MSTHLYLIYRFLSVLPKLKIKFFFVGTEFFRFRNRHSVVGTAQLDFFNAIEAASFLYRLLGLYFTQNTLAFCSNYIILNI